jgi:hypothetical protein
MTDRMTDITLAECADAFGYVYRDPMAGHDREFGGVRATLRTPHGDHELQIVVDEGRQWTVSYSGPIAADPESTRLPPVDAIRLVDALADGPISITSEGRRLILDAVSGASDGRRVPFAPPVSRRIGGVWVGPSASYLHTSIGMRRRQAARPGVGKTC